MKKVLYSILAAAAILTACTKQENFEVNPATPSGDESALFSGTIIQPNGLGDTRVTIDEPETTDSKVEIRWEAGDMIYVEAKSDKTKKQFSAISSSAATQFTTTDPDDASQWVADHDSGGYKAYFFGRNNAWESYTDKFEVSCEFDKLDGDNWKSVPVLLENMPLSAELGSCSDEYPRYFKFSSEFAVLEINVPSKLDFDKLYVCTDNQKVEFENGALKTDSSFEVCVKDAESLKDIPAYAGKSNVKIYVPITIPDRSYYEKITLVASKFDINDKETEVARMETYKYAGNKTSTPAQIGVAAHTIYFFDFCNTLTIEGETTDYTLTSNNTIDYRVNIAQEFYDGKQLKISATDQSTAPEKIFINAREYDVNDLVINTPYSHVEIDYGTSVTVTSNTSLNSFVVKEHYTINEVTVTKGSVVVEGNENKEANVSKVTIPVEGVDGTISVDVTGVSSTDASKKVKIENKNESATVSVVADPTDKSGETSNEYTIVDGSKDVTVVDKEVVATIGKTGYANLADAVAAVKDGETITLIKNVELESAISTGAKSFTLTLGANITPKTGWTGGQTLVDVNRGGALTINGNGKISNNGQTGVYAAVRMTGKNDSNDGNVAKLTVDGEVTLEGYYYGICGNGQRHNTVIIINGGTIKGTNENDNVGIYHPQKGILTINGGTIEGANGIYVKSGDVTASINAGTIKGVGTKQAYDPNRQGDGCAPTGDAIVFDNCGYPGGAPNADIKGGTFISVNAEAIASYARTGYTPITGFISGGTFSSDPWKYCAKGYASYEDGNNWIIVPAPKADVVRVHPDPDFSNVPQTILDNITVPFYQVKEMQGNIPVPVVEDGRILLSTDNQNGVYTLDNIISGSPYATLNGLDVCYIFAAREDDGTEGEFDNWNADFVISLDRTVQKDEIGLWGSYFGYLSRAFTAPAEIPANTEVPLLGTMTDRISNFTYDMIKSSVKVFPCGAFKLSNSVKDATMKVDLRIYDPNNSEKYFVIESYEYKFTNETNAVISKEVNSQDELNDAIANAKAGDGISIAAAGEYKLPASLPNITISGVEGVKLDCAGSGSIASIPNGATFKNVEITFGQSGYHGFQHAGHIIFDGCTFNGLFNSYGKITFNNCIFNQEAAEYNMWVYAGDTIYSGCIFNSKGKFLNVYNEGNDGGTPWNIVAENCVFNCTASEPNKAALNIKETCGEKALRYNVTITNCTCNDKQNGLDNAYDDTLYRVSPIWQVDDRKSGKDGIKVTVNNKVVYNAGAPVTE